MTELLNSILPKWLDFDYQHYEFKDTNDCFELVIGVKAVGSKWKLVFKDPNGFRLYFETDLCVLLKEQHVPDYCGVFLLMDSEHSKWFVQNSLFQRIDKVKNFIVKTENTIIDILAEEPPIIIKL